jgi:dTDP-6-deoxy-L-talose 4-dehydrogenase (NAD+)
LFYTFGEGQAPTSLYPQLSAAVRAGAKSFRMSPGDQLRDYLPVEGVAQLVADLALSAPGAGVVNVCSGRPIAVRTLVDQWIAENGWQIEIERGALPYSDYEPLASWGSRRRLDELLRIT